MDKCICFVCNFERTESINHIAKLLSKIKPKYNFSLVAIIHDHVGLNILEKKYFDKIVNLIDIRNISKNQPKFLINFNYEEEISKDRILKSKKNKQTFLKINQQGNLLQSELDKFKKIIFFGEISWLSESIIYEYSKVNSHNYLTPISIRYIDRRWSFAYGNSENELLSLNTNYLNDIELAEGPPEYFIEGVENLKFLNRYKNFIRNRFKSNVPNLIFKKILFIIINPILEFFRRTNIPNKNITYYYYAMHVQPEASIDYLSKKYRNQAKLCKEICKKLNKNEKLIIKEHPGETNLNYILFKIFSLMNPKIIYLKTKVSVNNYIKNINGVITVTGTIGGELALKNIKTVSLEKVFYNKLSKSYYASNINECLKILRSKVDKLGFNNIEFEDYLKNNSMKGYPYKTSTFGFKDPEYIVNFYEFIKSELDKCTY